MNRSKDGDPMVTRNGCQEKLVMISLGDESDEHWLLAMGYGDIISDEMHFYFFLSSINPLPTL